MKKITLPYLIVQFLKNNQGKKFTTKQIVEQVYQLNPEIFAEKKAALEKQGRDFWQQLHSESGYAHLTAYHHVIKREKDPVLKKDVLWYEDNSSVIQEPQPPYKPTEHDLYPILMKWLRNELGLYCLRIVERTSSNSKGKGGNKWLHPDIVAMKVLDQNWHKVVKDCVKASSSQRVELFSFEVKKEIGMSDVREYFFQTVSNSSWANEGYLVATSISDEAVKELRVLSSLHGIGVILLNPEQISESKILLPARHNFNVDWQSINRIASENKDFRKYIEYIETYYSSNKIYEELWNK